MKVYQSKLNQLPGTDYREVYPIAYGIFKDIKKKSKRKPYVRSAYFNKEKIFLDYFWPHIHQKNSRDRTRRLKLYDCALDVIQHSKLEPDTIQNVNRRSELLHRFHAATKEGVKFTVQVSQDLKSGKKHFISVFPK